MLDIRPNKKAREFSKFVPTLERRFKRGIRRGAYKSGSTVVRFIRTSLVTGKRTGRKYPRLPFRSSAPGEPPRSQTGRLVNGSYYKVRGYNEIRVGEKGKVPQYLEEGTIKMKPRPHVNVAIEKEERNVDNYLMKEPYKEIKF